MTHAMEHFPASRILANALPKFFALTAQVPTPPPIGKPSGKPAEIPMPPAGEVKDRAVGLVEKIAGFFKYDFFPNLWMYLTLVFMLVIGVVIFAGLNFIVRSITDPILNKVFRIPESSKAPAYIGGIASIVAAVIVFQWLYASFPTLQPPVRFLLDRFR